MQLLALSMKHTRKGTNKYLYYVIQLCAAYGGYYLFLHLAPLYEISTLLLGGKERRGKKKKEKNKPGAPAERQPSGEPSGEG